ncbi:DUF294 nucleotidyltransferase-like domain-containing protein [Hoeflea sp. Naph1]|uniref:DUF294 nucleotidyltransferase-like domain-containing protein n=1 Tax=Hoeflea sp. Naph1 TaxID=3388653 RepID=UPI00398FDD56
MSELDGLINLLDDGFSGIKSAHARSGEAINRIHAALISVKECDCCLVVNGSLARKELTESSDFDAFLIADGSLDDGQVASAGKLWSAAKEGAGLGDPGSSGVFSKESVINIDDMVQNIGGSNDDNSKITQRMLLVLESMPVNNIDLYNKLVDRIIERYISERITNHQLGLFLLNDIIRYYRTICIDFEFKTTELGKSWGLRNIKLVYSRKLIYFAGIVMCAEMAQKSWRQKRIICRDMMKMTPIERLLYVFGPEIHKSLRIYDSFIRSISDSEVREHLTNVDPDDRSESEVFTNLKNDGHHFAWALRSAFVNHYDSTHPIHKAIFF